MFINIEKEKMLHEIKLILECCDSISNKECAELPGCNHCRAARIVDYIYNIGGETNVQ